MNPRQATIERKTRETEITAELNLDGAGKGEVRTGIPFLDHMLESFAQHAGIDLELRCQGDLEVDDHHTAEDTALVLGLAVDKALGDRTGVRRFGSAHAPLDEALARAVVDLVARPHASIDLGLTRDRLGTLSTENLPHVLRSFASAARLCLHVDVLKGKNDHHRAEAAFKACALAFREAILRSEAVAIPSTKGAML